MYQCNETSVISSVLLFGGEEYHKWHIFTVLMVRMEVGSLVVRWCGEVVLRRRECVKEEQMRVYRKSNFRCSCSVLWMSVIYLLCGPGSCKHPKRLNHLFRFQVIDLDYSKHLYAFMGPELLLHLRLSLFLEECSRKTFFGIVKVYLCACVCGFWWRLFPGFRSPLARWG